MIPLALADAGPLISAAVTSDRHHDASLAALSDRGYELVIPAMCVAEACYMIASRRGPLVEAAFVDGLRDIEIIAPNAEDLLRMAELIRQYANFPLGATDASIVALAERLGVRTIITLDRRHFAAIRPRHCDQFEILPA